MNTAEQKRYFDECYDEYKSAISGIKITSLKEYQKFNRKPDDIPNINESKPNDQVYVNKREEKAIRKQVSNKESKV
jgi:dsDNA-specific endonuclease/ATPase MutS2